MSKRLSLATLFIWLATLLSPSLSQAQTVPVITSISTDIVSLADPFSSEVTFAIYGSDLGEVVSGEQTVWLGDFSASVVSGNASAVTLIFTITPAQLPSGDYQLVVAEGDAVVYASEKIVPVVNIFSLIPDRRGVRVYLDNVPHKKLSKKRVGLNVHYALGSSSDEDNTLEARLRRSDTRWMREHFSHALIMGDDQAAWLKRYDKAMQFAVDNHIRVVGMLAYGPTDGDFSAPSKQEWQEFVDLVVNRYKNVVDVWEVWNEPDSADYLDPSRVNTYVHLLKQASVVIRRNDSEAIILGGALASPNTEWTRTIFEQAADSFDDLSVHIYECEDWLSNGNFDQLDDDWQAMEHEVGTFRTNIKFWVTELGCSMGSSGVGESEQRQAIKHLTNHLINYGNVEVTFLYTIRDRSFLEDSDPYEAYFGLLNTDFSPKLVWKWYRKIRLNPRETTHASGINTQHQIQAASFRRIIDAGIA